MKKITSILIIGLSYTGLYAQFTVQKGTDLTIQSAVVLTIDTDVENAGDIQNDGGTISFSGNWDNQNNLGGFTRNSIGNILLVGANQQITGAFPLFFPSVKLEGTGIKAIKQQVDIDNFLDLGDLELSIHNVKLFLLNDDVNSLKRNEGFISSQDKGFFYRKINKTGSYLYPMGSKASGQLLYRPIEIGQNDNQNNNIFGIAFLEKNPDQAYYYRESKKENILDINSKFYHILDREEGNSVLRVNYFYSSVDGYSALANWKDNIWENIVLNKSSDLSDPKLDKLMIFDLNKNLVNIPVALANLTESYNLVFYNSYSPDGDGKNDTWTIGNIDSYPDNEISIFNRWGGEVFKTKAFSSTNRWDGSALKDGTYYYLLKVKIGDEYKVFKGFISLIKNQK